MPKKRIAITGLGVVSPIGQELNSFWNRLINSTPEITEINTFSVEKLASKKASMINSISDNYQQDELLRYSSRLTRMIVSSANQALSDSGIETQHREDVGVVVSTAFSCLSHRETVCKTLMGKGPSRVSPAIASRCVPSEPVGLICMGTGIRGINTILSSLGTSSSSAVKYSCDLIEFGRANAVIVACGDEISESFYSFLDKRGCLARVNGDIAEDTRPFDSSRNGFIAGEAAGAIIIEDLNYAQERGAKIYGEISCSEEFLAEYGEGGLSDTAVFSSANSSKHYDKLEAEDIYRNFGNLNPKVTAIKSILGETFGAAGMLNIISAAVALQKKEIPAIRNFQQADADTQLNIVKCLTKSNETNKIWVNDSGLNGDMNSWIIKSAVK